jgi:peptidoglycan/LPS O-acetylase OafA/YrhL
VRKSLSVYLDLLRIVAAIGVMVGHAHILFLPWAPDLIVGQASECVAVFFVLSGLVIGYVTAEKELSWRAYASARIARISSVVILAILAGFTLDFIGAHINIVPYRISAGWNLKPSLGDLLSYVTFSNEVWFRHAVIGTLEPYWSLGFEVLYYVVFGVALFMRGWRRVAALLFWALIAGPKIAMFLPVWLMGVGAYRLLARPSEPASWRPMVGGLLLVASAPAYFFLRYKIFPSHVGAMFLPGSYANLIRAGIYYDLLGLIVVFNVIGFDLLAGDRDVWGAAATKVIRWLAGGTFSIYLFHLPMEVFATALYPPITHSRLFGSAAVGAILVAAYALAEIGERRKRLFRKMADSVLRLSPAPYRSC